MMDWQRFSNPAGTLGWQQKAKAVIGELSRQSYEQAQRLKSGGKSKKHVPYSIPETAQKLVDALNRNDEETVKSILMYDYYAQGAWEAVQKRGGVYPPRSNNPVRSSNPLSRPDPEWDAEETERHRMHVILPVDPMGDDHSQTGLVERLYSWHGGQNSAVYSLASWGSSQLVSVAMIENAIQELKRSYYDKMSKEDREDLDDTIDDLIMISESPDEFSAEESGMDMSEDEYEYSA